MLTIVPKDGCRHIFFQRAQIITSQRERITKHGRLKNILNFPLHPFHFKVESTFLKICLVHVKEESSGNFVFQMSVMLRKLTYSAAMHPFSNP